MENGTKICCTCKQLKKLAEFNRYRASKDGRQRRCRDCQRSAGKTYYGEHRAELVASSRAWNVAHPERVAESERRRASSERRKAWEAAYAERKAQLQRDRYAKNPEPARKRARAWSQTPEARAWRRAYKQSRPQDDAYALHPERGREKARRRRARKRTAQVIPFTPRQLDARMAVFGYLCWMCGRQADTVDHVKPLAAGGAHALANLRPACRSCNSRKCAQWFGVEQLARYRKSDN